VDVAGGFETGWISRYPIGVGVPIVEFEPKPTDVQYLSAQFRPDTIIDGWSVRRFVLRGASMRGYWHRYVGSPRQDDFCTSYQPETGRLIVAVADGISGAPQSHVGSTVAARYSVEWLSRSVTADVGATDWKGLAESTAWALVEQARRIASDDQLDPSGAEELVATTLVCAVLDSDDATGTLSGRLISIGDSGAWTLGREGFENILGGKHSGSGGVSSSAVSGLPRVPAEVTAVEVEVRPGEVIMLGTDGFGDPLGDGTGDVGSLFAHVLGRGTHPSMLEFAHALDFSRETFDDDRTLVAVWPADVAGGSS
jgi:serine/threonine protein phosphatase PrpC